jgi:hypothetical protein
MTVHFVLQVNADDQHTHMHAVILGNPLDAM